MQQERGVAAPRKPLALGNNVPSLLKRLACHGTHSLAAILMSAQQDMSPGTEDVRCSQHDWLRGRGSKSLNGRTGNLWFLCCAGTTSDLSRAFDQLSLCRIFLFAGGSFCSISQAETPARDPLLGKTSLRGGSPS